MKIHVYTMAHNEEVLIPYFMRHYGHIAAKIYIYDNESTDKTAQIAGYSGATVIPFKGPYSDRHLLQVKNQEYKKSRGEADWIIAVDVDEFIWHPNLVELLEGYLRDGITLPQVEGYDMISEAPPCGPGQIYEEIRFGIKCHWYDKRAVFHPDLDINYDIGCHNCNPRGKITHSKKREIKLLHYRLLGIDYLIGRWRIRVARQTDEQIQNRWSPIVSLNPDVTRAWLDKYKSQYPPTRIVP